MGGAFVFPIIQKLLAEIWYLILNAVYSFSIENLAINLFRDRRYGFQGYWDSIDMGVDILSMVSTVIN